MANIIHEFKENGVENICDYCGESVPKSEPYDKCAELTPNGKLACWDCQCCDSKAQDDLWG